MNIVIETTSEKPIYQQISEQIISQIIKGEIKGNYSLPSIRTAAKELRISIITIKKAWEELERQGFIYTIAGKGCFVSELSFKETKQIRNDLTNKQMIKDIQYYKELGLTVDEILKKVKEHY